MLCRYEGIGTEVMSRSSRLGSTVDHLWAVAELGLLTVAPSSRQQPWWSLPYHLTIPALG